VKSILSTVAAAVVILTQCVPLAVADDAALQRKVAELEQTVKGLVDTVKAQAGEIESLKAADKSKLYEARLAEARRQLDAAPSVPPAGKFPVLSGQEIELYGYIKLDAAWDSARSSNGNFARWVESEGGRNNDDTFNVTARQTRLGMRLTDPGDHAVKTTGRVEVDFYGDGAENKPEAFMRHAYLQLEWPEHQFSILAGQTSDVISPLVPGTVNYTVLWWQGNIGYRRPQVRLTKGFDLTENVNLNTQVAVTRTIGRTNTLNGDRTDPGDTGEDHGLPGLQARAAVTFPLLDGKPTTVGVSGHFAKEEIDTDLRDSHQNVCSWSANLDVAMPVTGWMTIKGELFTGQDLDAYLGGIGQGVDMNTLKPIQSCGGWGAVGLGPWEKWRFNVGAGVDAVDGGDVTASTARTVNRAIFGNVLYQITKNATVAFEVSHLHTEYKGLQPGDSVRLHSAFMYSY